MFYVTVKKAIVAECESYETADELREVLWDDFGIHSVIKTSPVTLIHPETVDGREWKMVENVDFFVDGVYPQFDIQDVAGQYYIQVLGN